MEVPLDFATNMAQWTKQQKDDDIFKYKRIKENKRRVIQKTNEKEYISEEAWEDLKLVLTFALDRNLNFIKAAVLLVLDQ